MVERARGQVGVRRASYEDLVAVPEHLIAEIIDGELVTSPRPAPRHALASSMLGGALIGGAGSSGGGPGRRDGGGWWILDEPELHLEGHVLVPDFAGWRRARMPTMPAEAYFALPPDWICEVLSPSTAGRDRVRKLPIYGAHGVGHVWLLDPGQRTLEVFRLQERLWVLVGAFEEAEIAAVEPFDDFELALATLWPPEAEPTS